MEFKKPHTYRSGRQKLTVPERASSLKPSHSQPPQGSVLNSKPKEVWSKRYRPSKTIVMVAGIVVVAASLTTGTFISQNVVKQLRTDATSEEQILENLEYQSVLPQDKAISELGGWKRVSPPDGLPVYAYTDTIENTPISVSQQPLPEDLKNNATEQVAELAKKFNAVNKIDGAGTDVYIGTSAKGPQSVIFTKNNLLILMKSQKNIENTAWAEYIKSLN